MKSNGFIKFTLFGLSIAFLYHTCIAIPRKCALESTCSKNATITEKVCVLDEEKRCIRQYPSKCHLEIAACKLAKNFTDHSNIYCALESFLCDNEYEHWTIFFGHENKQVKNVTHSLKKKKH